MKVASSALPSSAIIFFLIVVADLRGLFTNKCMMYTSTTMITPVFLEHYSIEMHFYILGLFSYFFSPLLFICVCVCVRACLFFPLFFSHELLGSQTDLAQLHLLDSIYSVSRFNLRITVSCTTFNAEIQSG